MGPTSDRLNLALVFNHSNIVGGGEISFINLIRSLPSGQYRMLILVPGRGEIAEQLVSEGKAVEIISLPQVRPYRLPQVATAVARLIRLFQKNGVDLIHVNGSRACLYCIAAGGALRLPVIWHVRETKTDKWYLDGLLARLSRRILCASKAIADERFHDNRSLVNGKMEVIHNGVDADRFRPSVSVRAQLRSRLGAAHGDVLIGMVGNIKPLKGQIHLIRAMARLVEEGRGDGTSVILIGKIQDARYLALLQQEIDRARLSEVVRFQDFVTDPLPFFQAMDIFVLASRREGFSRSLIEAMGVGLPVIASRIDAIAEAVPDEKHAILVDPQDTVSFAAAIARLVASPDLRHEMGERNRQRVLQEFSHDRHAARVIAAYKNMVSFHPRRPGTD